MEDVAQGMCLQAVQEIASLIITAAQPVVVGRFQWVVTPEDVRNALLESIVRQVLLYALIVVLGQIVG